MSVPKGTVKLWFDYLRIAALAGLEVNWKFYKEWGTSEELLNLSFNKWWTTKGRELFASDALVDVEVQLVERTDSFVVLKVPLDRPVDDIKAAVSNIVLKARHKRRIGQRGQFAVSGQINYKTLAQYKRFLEIDFWWGGADATIAEKTSELIRQYEKIHARGMKQRKTLRQSGRASVALRFSTRDPEELSRREIGGISPKMVSRWRLSGKHILLNVAEGKFPGDGYYGSRLRERLVSRLQPLGLSDIGSAARVGGRRRGRKLSSTELNAKARELERRGLKAYSTSKSDRGLSD